MDSPARALLTNANVVVSIHSNARTTESSAQSGVGRMVRKMCVCVQYHYDEELKSIERLQ